VEGISEPPRSQAQQLGKLIMLYDDNRFPSTVPPTSPSPRTCALEAYGWHVQKVADGNDVEAINAAITAAKAETGKPSIIAVRTHIGCGSPNKQDKAAAHGAPLGADEVKLTKEACDWPLDRSSSCRRREAFSRGGQRGQAHAVARARLPGGRRRRAASWDDAWAQPPAGWDADLPSSPEDGRRGHALGAARPSSPGAHLPTLIGGSADLAPSTTR
jgi:transketolase